MLKYVVLCLFVYFLNMNMTENYSKNIFKNYNMTISVNIISSTFYNVTMITLTRPNETVYVILIKYN